jgi:transposase
MQLKEEQRTRKRLADEVESLKKELHKQSFQQFTSSSSEVSVTAGRLPLVPGVREITMDDLQFGE